MEIKNAQADSLKADIIQSFAGGDVLTGGNFGTPTTPIYLTFDYDIAAQYEVKLCTVVGSTLSVCSHISGADIAHSSGCKVGRMINAEVIDDLKNTDINGWVDPQQTWAYASTTTITVPAGAASIYSVGDKIRFQNNNSGTYLYNKITVVADTLLTVNTANVPNATLTDNYYSKVNTPVGSPYNTFVGARAYLASTLTTTAQNDYTKVALDTESYDVGGNFASNKFVAPVNGYYRINGFVQYQNAGSGDTYRAAIYKNGALVSFAGLTGGAGVDHHINVDELLYVAASSYIELYYYHSAATTTDITGGATSTHLTVQLLKEV